jgi:adenylate cyclase
MRSGSTALATGRVERRLAAILAADVAGYSRLMGADEEGTHERLKALRRELADPKIKEHRGRIVKTTGDGLLIEFASVVDAVRCAVEVQREMAERNADVSPDRRIEFRMGINLGDIIKDGRDICGDGVNVAARLEALAETRRDLRQPGRARSGTRQAGRFIRGYGRAAGQEHRASRARAPYRARRRSGTFRGDCRRCGKPALSAADKPSIAVLPFQNMSGDPEQEYFADGMVEEIPVTDVLDRISERCQIMHAMGSYNSRTRLIVKLKSTSRARVGSNRSLSIFVRYLINSINTLSSVKNSALSPSCGSPIDADAVDF